MSNGQDRAIQRLSAAFAQRRLTLYLGAGVSVGNGLPTWERLVLAMYYSVMSQQRLGSWRPFANYLYAIAEWQLGQTREPLEITARKLRNLYGSDGDGRDDREAFLRDLWETLWAGFVDDDGRPSAEVHPQAIRAGNPTLDAVARLIEAGSASRGVRGVITYNYDNLVEMVLEGVHHQSIYQVGPLEEDAFPIAHVHGFVPLSGDGSLPDDIVFTEDQYHMAARDPYSWANLVQIQAMSSTVGLMVGLSLSDRNIRRLLDAIAQAPLDSESFILLKRPPRDSPELDELSGIHNKAVAYLDRFRNSGIKGGDEDRVENVGTHVGVKSAQPGPMSSSGVKGPMYAMQIAGILEEVRKVDEAQQTKVLGQLGVHPIWYDEHDEIPQILDRIPGGS
jgi:hypothetical protein